MVSIRSGLSRASLTSLIRPWLCCGSSFKTSTCSVIPTSSVKPRFHSPVSDQVARPITDATEFVMRWVLCVLRSCSKYITWPTCVKNLKSLAVAVAEIFQECKILQCVTWPWPRPFQRWLVISRLGLATVNPQTQFEVSNYPHYEDMKSSAKCTNCGNLGHLGVTQNHFIIAMSPCNRGHTTSYLTLTQTMHLSCIVFEI